MYFFKEEFPTIFFKEISSQNAKIKKFIFPKNISAATYCIQ